MAEDYSAFKESKEDSLAVGAKGGAIAFTLKTLSAALGLLNQIVLARILGATSVGEIILAVSVVKISVLIAKFGMDEAMMRFIPPYIDQGDNARLKGTIQFALKFCFLLSIIFVFLVLLFSKFISFNFFQSDVLSNLSPVAKLLPIAAIAIPAIVVRDTIGGILKSYKDVYQALLPECVISPFFRLVIFLILTLKGIYPLFAIIAFISGELLAVSLSIKFLLRRIAEIGPVKKQCDNKKVLEVSYTFIFASLSLFLYTQADVWVLGIFTTMKEVGVYGYAARMVLLLYFPMTAFATIIPSLVSSTYASGKFDELRRITRESARWILSMAMPLVLVLIFEGRFILRHFYGSEFVEGYTVLVILTATHLINTASGLIGALLQMTGGHKVYMKINIILGILNVILNIFLVPRFGMIGAAMSTAFCLVMLDIICVFIIYRRLSVLTLAKGLTFDVFFLIVVSILYAVLSFMKFYTGYHILLACALAIYLWKSVVHHDIPWRLLIAKHKEG